MTDEQIEKIALANGFKLKKQPDGSMALNPYVFEFARAMYAKGRQAYKNQSYHLLYSTSQPIGAVQPEIHDEITDFTAADAARAQELADRSKVVVACDHIEAKEFVEWLNKAGYSATLGNDTHHRIGGYDTSTDEEANSKMKALWDRYCDEA